MKFVLRLVYALIILVGAGTASAQIGLPPKISRIDIKHVGPASVNDDLIRGHIHVKPGDPYIPATLDDDVESLYSTGLFHRILVGKENAPDGGLVLTFAVQEKLRLTDIKIEGNEKLSRSKLLKKVTSKEGEPLDERKLLTDSLALEDLYQKSGYSGTTVKYSVNLDETAGRGTATFVVKETEKIRIERIDFVGAQVFSPKKLRKEIKTKAKWMWSWLTGRGRFKEDQFEEDRDRLTEFYRDHGYIDFDIKDVQFDRPTPKTMIIRIFVYEGRQYKVGSVKFEGTTLLPTNAVSPEFNPGHEPKKGLERAAWVEARTLNRGFEMKVGSTFTSRGLGKDLGALEDFYGARGHIDVNSETGNLRVRRVANTETSTMDLEFSVNEGQESFVEKIEIRGNTKTKDKVIRRELAIAPGEVFDMVSVGVSKQRLEGLDYFSKVDARPENTELPNRKNLVVGVEEKNTGNMTMGAGFNSVESVVGFVEVTQGNFDLFHPPNFTGGGQKFRLRIQLGTEQQDYTLTFSEPWLFDRKLRLDTDLYHRRLSYQSVESLYDEVRTGFRLGLTRALGSDHLIGSLGYNLEEAGILLNQFTNVPNAILAENGYSLLSRVNASIAYDTRGAGLLPNKGQRTELMANFTGGPLGGDKEFYKLELKTAWYFPGFFKGHVLELVGRTGVAESLDNTDVPFYERYYLGGLYSLRGFKYRGISPREAGSNSGEPIGGDTYWFGSMEYSIPIFEKERGVGVRFALFYDIGAVQPDPFQYTGSYSDNYGFGLRLNLPIGPLRLDYGIPINHDANSSGSGRFQFGVGYRREF